MKTYSNNRGYDITEIYRKLSSSNTAGNTVAANKFFRGELFSAFQAKMKQESAASVIKVPLRRRNSL